MQKLILKLANIALVRRLIKFLRFHLLANAWLHRFPIVKTVPGSSIRYRARRLESLCLAVEMFQEGTLYTASGLPTKINTFADLGCNVGYFTCWLSRQQGAGKLRGLMVDANPEAIEDARWHVEANRLSDVHVLHGLAGAPAQAGESDFFMHTSNVCSSATPETAVDADGSWTKIKVPSVSVEENWAKNFGNAACDLLKIDIEGAELDFFQAEPAFVSRVQALLIEWHKWRVSLDDLKKFLGNHGLTLEKIIHEDATLGTALFLRKTLTGAPA